MKPRTPRTPSRQGWLLPTTLVLASLFVFVMGLNATADDPPDDKARAAAAFLRAKPDVEALAIRPAVGSNDNNSNKGSETYKLHPESILKWTNPGSGEFFGNVFVWMDKGRPEVVASVNDFHGVPRRRELEVHSTSTSLFIAERDGQPLWSPSRPGIEWKPLPGAATPSDSAAGRFRQIREIAREFTATRISDDGIESPLRMLVQPLIRYGAEKEVTLDGSMFAFVDGTDPEVFLMIEARMVDGKPTWQFAAVRFVRFKLRLDRRNEAVWTMPRIFWPQVIDHTQPYTDFDLVP